VAGRGLQQRGALGVDACRWNSGWIAPCATASSVNRYAVPISTPIRGARARASGAASAATIAADRSSWTPPAKKTCSSRRRPPGARRGTPSSTASCASQSGKLARGPTWPPHSAPSKTNLRAPASQELPQQPRRGHVQEGRDAVRLQRRGLRRPAARDDRVRRPDLPDDLELRGAHVLGREAEHADAPGPVAERFAGLQQHPRVCSRRPARAR
jgi:hypothetical protein